MSVSSNFFQVGGTLSADAPSYITRPADERLLEALKRHELCLVLAPRQTGKSSLMVHAIASLADNGMRAAVVDLQPLGSEKDFGQWFVNVIYQMERFLKLKTDSAEWWNAHVNLGPSQRFITFLEDVVLKEVNGNVVIFLDEIDSVLALPFSDDFFTTIRSIYNARATNAALRRLSFVLLGVANPSSFIKNRARTPFNIGTSIILEDFNKDSIEPFQKILGPQTGDLIDRLFYWTSGQPLLVQKLAAAAHSWPSTERTSERLDDEVKKTFLQCRVEQDTHLKFIQDLLLDESTDRRRLLGTYRNVIRGKAIANNERSPTQQQLKLAGVVRIRDGKLVGRNRIYEGVFDAKWIREHMPTYPLKWITVATFCLLILVLVWFLGIQPRLIPEFPQFSKIYTSNSTVDLPLSTTNLRNAFLDGRQIPIGPQISLTDLPVGESKHILKLSGWLPWHTREIIIDVTHFPRWEVRQFPDARLTNINPTIQIEKNSFVLRDINNGKVLRRFAGHKQDLVKVSWSADRRTILSLSRDRLAIWDAQSGKLLSHLADQSPGFVDAMLTHDARTIVFAQADNSLKLANTDDPGKAHVLAPAETSQVTSVAISPDGRAIVEGFSNGQLKLWDVLARKATMVFGSPTTAIVHVTFSQSGALFAAASGDGFVRVWTRNENETKLVDEIHQNDPIESVAFSPDGKTVLTASAGNLKVRVWRERRDSRFKTNTGKATEAAYSPDGRLIYLISTSGEFKVWDSATFEEVEPFAGHQAPFGNPSDLYVLQRSDEGKILSVGEKREVKVWDPSTGRHLFTFNPVSQCEFLSASNGIICLQGGKVKLWDLLTGNLEREFAANRSIDVFAVTPDGKLISATREGFEGNTDLLYVFETATGAQQVKSFDASDLPTHFFMGKTFQLGHANGILEIWDVETRRLISTINSGHPDLANALFSNTEDGSRLVLLTRGKLDIWDVAQGKLLRSITVGSEVLDDLSFSPKGDMIVTTSKNTATFYDVNTGEKLGPPISTNAAVKFVYDFSPDQTRVILPNFSNEMALYEIKTGRVLRTFSGHNGEVIGAVFMPDGKTMVTASKDGTIKVWWTELQN